MASYTIKNVTHDLAFLMSLTKAYAADSKGFWIDAHSKERFSYALDKDEDPKEIVLFQDPMPKGDYYYFNPFAEGLGDISPINKLFYRIIRMAFNLNYLNVVAHVIEKAWESKNDTSVVLSPAVVRMGSVHVDKKMTLVDYVDEEFLKEAKTLIDRLSDECIHVPYFPKFTTARVQCGILTDKTWDEKYGMNIRKKSLTAFRAAIMGVLGISKPEELEKFSVKYDPDMKTAPRLHTTLMVYYKLYSQFNDALAEASGADGKADERAEINLGGLLEVIERMPSAYAIAKHMIQPVIPKHKANDTAPADTSAFSVPNAANDKFKAPVIASTNNNGFGGGFSIAPTQQDNRFKAPVVGGPAVDPMSPAYASFAAQPQMQPSVGFGQPAFGVAPTSMFGNGGFGNTFSAAPATPFGGGGFSIVDSPMTRSGPMF